MAQHFLISAAARTLRLKDVYAMGEEKAFEAFCSLRWAETDGNPVCPACGHDKTYAITTRRQFKCRACHRQFSPTSGTILADRKMSYTDLLAAICIFVNSVKGISSLQLARDVGCHPKSAWVLAHKLREALSAELAAYKVSGDVEVDGMYTGGSIRPANLKENRIDRRLAQHQTGKRRVVVAFRERGGRTVPLVVMSEAEGVAIANRIALPSTVLVADEASHWDALGKQFVVQRINHSEAYSLDGISTNQVESFFARLRRMIRGQHHWVSPQHLHQYAREAAWKEDHRRVSNGDQAGLVLALTLAYGVSETWCGRWQRKHHGR
jgi:transposase-like protein